MAISHRGTRASPAVDPEDAAAALSTALRIVSAADQSSAGLGGRLARRGYGDAVVANVVGRMQDRGHLDDAALAASLARRLVRRGHGRSRVVADLRRRLIAEDVIADVVAGIDDATERRAALGLINRSPPAARTGDEGPRAAARLARRLARRGFSAATITHTIRGTVLPEAGQPGG